MSAYWVARSKINDPVEYKKYTDLVPAIIAKFGGKVLALGGRLQIMKGDARRARPAGLCQGRPQGAGAWRPFPDHGAPRHSPPLHRDRVSGPGAGRRLLHIAGI